MIRNGPLKISKSLKKAENGPFGKNLFPITAVGMTDTQKKISRTLIELHQNGGTHKKKCLPAQQHKVSALCTLCK